MSESEPKPAAEAEANNSSSDTCLYTTHDESAIGSKVQPQFAEASPIANSVRKGAHKAVETEPEVREHPPRAIGHRQLDPGESGSYCRNRSDQRKIPAVQASAREANFSAVVGVLHLVAAKGDGDGGERGVFNDLH